ncbi:MAG TPA: glycoside hydrolase family 2 TIM barrel-domain containing protein [Pseudosphingobacterium sp.]|nr:glycoside hydrolase family 2 TIM barrel-domain containing protein [Pseudosphingobacterium sp.]
MKYLRRLGWLLIGGITTSTYAQTQPTLGNIYGRNTTSLNGNWEYIVDPYETGFYNYRWQERAEDDKEAYWADDRQQGKLDLKEFGYTAKNSLRVPGDWNSQEAKFLFYEGTVWYAKRFNYPKLAMGNRLFLYFGAVNYEAHVYLNGKKLGSHKGGFSPFNFEVPANLLKTTDNFLVVKVDNKRKKDEIPTLNTDWWNYGGITRDVLLAEVPENYIQNYSLHLRKNTGNQLTGWIKLARSQQHGSVTVSIPELKIKKEFPIKGDSVPVEIKAAKLKLWDTSDPKLYEVIITAGHDELTEKIGFRDIQVDQGKIRLNGKELFLRGICVHEEIPTEIRRAYNKADAIQLLTQARSLNANMVRLAHYPHNEYMVKVADSLGVLVWSEIPVYWTVDFENAEVLAKAKGQLKDMIERDRNRASVVIWSVGNETPVHTARTRFMSSLVKEAKQLDATRIVSAALEKHERDGVQIVDDPLGEYTDIVSVNEYIGWYGSTPNAAKDAKWEIKYDKPLFFSETGAEALGAYHADSLTRFSEEFQKWYYVEQVEMMKRMPANYVGMSPWILNDFRSPRRNNPLYQEGWNNKGLFDQKGNKKSAFFVLKKYYDELEEKYK